MAASKPTWKVKLQEWAAIVTAGTLVVGLLNTVAGFILIQPAIAAMDEHNDARYAKIADVKEISDKFDAFEKRQQERDEQNERLQRCERVETERNQIKRYRNRAREENASPNVLRDYDEQYNAYDGRFKSLQCDDVFEGIYRSALTLGADQA